MRFSGFFSFLFTGRPFSRKELADVRNEISFAEAIAAHLAWKKRLIDGLDDHVAPATNAADAGDDTACTLGRWINDAGRRRYEGLSSFAEVRNQHAKFHCLARQIVELERAHNNEAARRLMAGEFESVSRGIVAHLHHMSRLFGR